MIKWQLQVKILDTKATSYNGMCLSREQLFHFWSGEKRKPKKIPKLLSFGVPSALEQFHEEFMKLALTQALVTAQFLFYITMNQIKILAIAFAYYRFLTVVNCFI